MIVTCERCQTHFRLDAQRVSETGVLVRCSRCKHAFVVKRPEDPPEDETLDVEEGFDWEFDNAGPKSTQADADGLRDESGAAEPPDAPPPPEPDLALESESAEETVDSLLELDGIDDEPEAAFEAAVAESPLEPRNELASEPLAESGLEMESGPHTEPGVDAEPFGDALAGPFDEALAEPDAAGADALGARDGESDPEAPRAAAEDGVDELGSPDEWDIFDAPGPAGARAPLAPRPAASREERRLVEADSEREDGPVEVWLARAAAGAGWTATLVLAALVLAHGLRPPTPVAAGAVAVAPGITVEDVDARWVDNAVYGEVYVVSASVRNGTSGPVPVPALELVLRDAANRAVGEPIAVGGPHDPEVLREGGRDDLARTIPMLLGLRPGETRRFEAVAWPLPAAAERFEFRTRRP